MDVWDLFWICWQVLANIHVQTFSSGQQRHWHSHAFAFDTKWRKHVSPPKDLT